MLKVIENMLTWLTVTDCALNYVLAKMLGVNIVAVTFV